MPATLLGAIAAVGSVGTLAGCAGWVQAHRERRARHTLEDHHAKEMHRMAEQQPIDEIVAQALAAQAAHEQGIGAQTYDAGQRATAAYQRARREFHHREIEPPADLRERIERLVT